MTAEQAWAVARVARVDIRHVDAYGRALMDVAAANNRDPVAWLAAWLTLCGWGVEPHVAAGYCESLLYDRAARPLARRLADRAVAESGDMLRVLRGVIGVGEITGPEGA